MLFVGLVDGDVKADGEFAGLVDGAFAGLVNGEYKYFQEHNYMQDIFHVINQRFMKIHQKQ